MFNQQIPQSDRKKLLYLDLYTSIIGIYVPELIHILAFSHKVLILVFKDKKGQYIDFQSQFINMLNYRQIYTYKRKYKTWRSLTNWSKTTSIIRRLNAQYIILFSSSSFVDDCCNCYFCCCFLEDRGFIVILYSH